MGWRGHSPMVFRQTGASLLLGIAICVGLFIGCSREHSAALTPYQGATGISFREFGGADHVTYHVNTKFPAAELIERISDKLAKEGWKGSQHDELNPGGYSGDIAVWKQRILGSGQKERCAEDWICDWRNAPGDFLRITLSTTVQCLTLDRTWFLLVNAILPCWSTWRSTVSTCRLRFSEI